MLDVGEVFQEQRSGGVLQTKRSEIVIQRAIVGEGKALGFRLQEKVEGIQHRHFRHEIHFDGKLTRLFGKDQPGQVIRLRILLPVDEMFFGRDSQRIAQDSRPGVRRGSKADGLRAEGDRAVIFVMGFVVELDVYGHEFSPESDTARWAPRRWCRRVF